MKGNKKITRGLPLFLLGLGFLVLVLPNSASAQSMSDWKQKWQKVQSEAKKEGKVVVLGPSGAAIRKGLTQGFMKAFPDITIEYTGGRGSRLVPKIKAERDAGIFSMDVFITGSSTYRRLKGTGALSPVKPALILPEVTNPKNWRNNRLNFEDVDEMYDLAFIGMISPIVLYNADLVKPEEIDETSELLDPKWKGKIVINDPLVGGTGFTVFRHFWATMGPEKATEYYKKIRSQAAAVTRNLRLQIEWVASGKYPILLGPSGGMSNQMRKRGLKFEILTEWKDIGAFINSGSGGVMLFNKAPHPNAATVFINWILSKEGQTIYSKASGQLSNMRGVPRDHLSPDGIPKHGGKYWNSSLEINRIRSKEETKILKELFGK